jgi:hypothetical protein
LELLVPASVLGKSNLTESPSLGLRNKTSLQTVFEQLVLGGRALAVVIITVAVFLADQRVACYKNSKKLPPVRLDTFTTLKIYFWSGKLKLKGKRISADKAHVIVMEDITAEDWHERLLVTVARVKAFFVYSKDKRDELITLVKVPSGAHTEETSEDIEEAELDKALDLDAAEDAPTDPNRMNAW